MDEKHQKMREEPEKSALMCNKENWTQLGENCCISTGEILLPENLLDISEIS